MLVRRQYNPLRDLASLRERMNRVLEEEAVRGGGETLPPAWVPAVDIHETDRAVVLRVELPGVGREHVHVEVKEGVLTIRGEKRSEKEVREESFHRMERSYGAFSRSFSLPPGVDSDRVTAAMRDGVLEVSVAKKEAAKPRRIAVTG